MNAPCPVAPARIHFGAFPATPVYRIRRPQELAALLRWTESAKVPAVQAGAPGGERKEAATIFGLHGIFSVYLLECHERAPRASYLIVYERQATGARASIIVSIPSDVPLPLALGAVIL